MFRRNPWQEVISGVGESPPFLKLLLASLALGCVGEAVAPGGSPLELLRLSPDVWEHGEVWRLVTYGLVGQGGISAWSVMQLVLVYWLVMQMITWLRSSGARSVILGGVVFSGATAVLAHLVSDGLGGPVCEWRPFWMIQGQGVLVALGLASFAATNRYSTVSHTPLLFGLAIPTRWLVPLQLLMALGGALATGDVGGGAGIAAATAWGWTQSMRRQS